MTFNEYTLAHEPAIRLAAFFGIFALMAAWEVAAPRRVRLHSRPCAGPPTWAWWR
jgi:hypothetical protein